MKYFRCNHYSLQCAIVCVFFLHDANFPCDEYNYILLASFFGFTLSQFDVFLQYELLNYALYIGRWRIRFCLSIFWSYEQYCL